MAQLGSLQDNQKNSYAINGSGEVCQRVCVTDFDAGAITVNVEAPCDMENIFATVSSVATATLTTVLSYTVPVGKEFCLQKIEAGGENIARFDVLKNATLMARKRSYFGGPLHVNFEFVDTTSHGVKFDAGDIIDVKVQHERPMSGDFEARINGVLKNA